MRSLDISELDFVAGGLDYASPEGLGDSNGDGIGDITIYGERMDAWDKIWYDIKEIFSSDSSSTPQTFDIETPVDVSESSNTGIFYTTTGVNSQYGLGLSVTTTNTGDVLIGIEMGRPGLGVTGGVTPPGTDVRYLEGGSYTVIGLDRVGVSGPTNSDPAHIVAGTPGFSVGYNVNVTDVVAAGQAGAQAVETAVNDTQDAAIRIGNQAAAYTNPTRFYEYPQ